MDGGIKNDWLKIAGVFGLFFSFALLILGFLSNGLPADDGGFYATLGKLQTTASFIKDLPWLAYTPLAESSPGLHWLYPILLSWLHLLAPEFPLHLLTSAVGFSLAITTTYFILTKLKVKSAFIWTLILSTSAASLTFRLLLARPISLSVCFILLGWYFAKEKKLLPLFSLAVVYTWLYDAYILLPLVVGVSLFLDFDASICSRIKTFLSTLSGILVGLIVNPYFPENILFRHFSVTPVWLNKLQNSVEWLPVDPNTFFTDSAIFFTLWILLVFNLLLSIPCYSKGVKNLTEKLNLPSLIPAVLFLVATFFSKRFIEYAAPFTVLAASQAYPYVKNELSLLSISKKVKKVCSVLLTTCLVIVGLYSTKMGLSYYNTSTLQTVRLSAPAEYLSINSSPKELVFNTQWDQFPQLFYWNQKNYYVVGLDPLFMYEYDQTLYWKWRKITDEIPTAWTRETVYLTTKKDFGAKFVFLENFRNPKLLEYLISQPQDFTLGYQDDYTTVFRIN